MAAFASCRVEQLVLLSGTPAAYRASERAIRQFCAECGSTLFWRPDGGAELDVFLGSFDQPSRLPKPEYAIWAAHRVEWLPELPGVPTFAGHRSA